MKKNFQQSKACSAFFPVLRPLASQIKSCRSASAKAERGKLETFFAVHNALLCSERRRLRKAQQIEEKKQQKGATEAGEGGAETKAHEELDPRVFYENRCKFVESLRKENAAYPHKFNVGLATHPINLFIDLEGVGGLSEGVKRASANIFVDMSGKHRQFYIIVYLPRHARWWWYVSLMGLLQVTMTLGEFQEKYGGLADGAHLPEEEVCVAGSAFESHSYAAL